MSKISIIIPTINEASNLPLMGGHRYEFLSNDTPDHHHFICIRCGRTEEFENDEVLDAGKVAAKVNCFKLSESSLNVRAICPICI